MTNVNTANGFRIAGVEYSKECFCNTVFSGVLRPASECSYACSGDPTQSCGGSARIAMYQDRTFNTISPGLITGYSSKGCYSEAKTPPALSIKQGYLDSSKMTVEICLTNCKSRGFPLAGLQGSGNCHCSVVLGAGSEPISPAQCGLPCNGDNTQTCGGETAYSLYTSEELMEARPCSRSTAPTYGIYEGPATPVYSYYPVVTVTKTGPATTVFSYYPVVTVPTTLVIVKATSLVTSSLKVSGCRD